MIVDANEPYVQKPTPSGHDQTSLFPRAAAAAGISFSALLDRLIALALEDARTVQ
jgi:D-alanine-D-alanine ligase